MATKWTLGCDAHDPHRIAEFWAGAVGYVNEPRYDDPDGASIIDPDGRGPAIGSCGCPRAERRRIGCTFTSAVAGEPRGDLADRVRLTRAKVQTLTAFGATVVREESFGEQLGHVVMLDPEGKEFCVA